MFGQLLEKRISERDLKKVTTTLLKNPYNQKPKQYFLVSQQKKKLKDLQKERCISQYSKINDSKKVQHNITSFQPDKYKIFSKPAYLTDQQSTMTISKSIGKIRFVVPQPILFKLQAPKNQPYLNQEKRSISQHYNYSKDNKENIFQLASRIKSPSQKKLEFKMTNFKQYLLNDYKKNTKQMDLTNLETKECSTPSTIIERKLEQQFKQKLNYKISFTQILKHPIEVVTKPVIQPLPPQNIVNLASLTFEGLIGRVIQQFQGSFGEVFQVKFQDSQYALKVLDKQKIKKDKLQKYVVSERNVLAQMDNPFIVKLYACFQTSRNLFFLMQYGKGGDLGKSLQAEKSFSESRAKIYLCELILAIEALHQKNIIYRDLKPENIVLDSQGHVLLTDFGLSKEGVDMAEKGGKSFCGSLAYLAPEMLLRKGHGKAVDWYLLGVVFYEMLTGRPPFFANNQQSFYQRFQLFENIKKGQLKMPCLVTSSCKSLLHGLLQRNPNQRLGSINDAKEIKNHIYFNDINWDDVYKKQFFQIRNLKVPIPNSNQKLLKVHTDFIEDDKDSNTLQIPNFSFTNF